MLIQSFCVPTNECADLGLSEINMRRLGRFVALAGKNGAGKSRILKKLEFYVQARRDGLAHVHSWRQQVSNYQSAIQRDPGSANRSSWDQGVATCLNQLDATLRRVFAEDSLKFKAVRFVPKQLNLQDPRQYIGRELVSRYAQAKSPGVDGYENSCLFYIQQLQNRWWNADHQKFSGTREEKAEALAEYEKFKTIVLRMLGVDLDRDLNGEPTLFGKPIADAGLSDGQKVILQLCVALHAQRSELDNTIFILDEPENHLHPSAAIDLLKSLYELTDRSQIWIATHSIPLLAYVASVDPMSLWYVDSGSVSNAGRHPEVVLDSLLGGDERIEQLNSFTALPAQLAVVNYAVESLFPPKVAGAGRGDPQISQIQRLVSRLAENDILNILDFGAGKGRLLEGLVAEIGAQGEGLPKTINYFAYDKSPEEKPICQSLIETVYSDGKKRHFDSREEFFSHKTDASIDVVLMCNVLHEISPHEWLNVFSEQSLISRGLRGTGYLLLVEDQRIPTGENAHEFGFILLDTSHLRTLFSVTDQDISLGLFEFDDSRGDGRLKAHLISKSLFARMTASSIRWAIEQLRETAKENIKQLRRAEPSYANGQLHGFWTQQFANTSLYLEGA